MEIEERSRAMFVIDITAQFQEETLCACLNCKVTVSPYLFQKQI